MNSQHLSTTLADQADHVDLRGRRAGDHAQQRRLADAGAGEDAEALAAAARDERVERAHAERHALVDARARQRIAAAPPRRGRHVRSSGSGPCRPADGRGRRARGRAARRRRRPRSGWPVAITRAPGPMPVGSPSAISSVRPARKPTTSAGTAARPRPVSIVHTSPTSASRPVASTIRPIRSTTRPWRRCRSAVPRRQSSCVDRVERRIRHREHEVIGARDHDASAAATTSRARSSLVSTRASTSPTGVRTMRAAAADAPLGLDLAVLDAAERRPQRRPSPRARSRGRPG